MKADKMISLLRLTALPFFCASVLLAAGPCLAQTPAEMTLSQAESMPSWTVPVLRLVSATHVEPTTGVVISDSGLVLVPADFAGIGDEIIVLDGGTDIIRNGRPAKITHRFGRDGLQVLSVKGLQRTGATFSTAPLKDGDPVRLSAFPPAELIAEGAAPLDIETAVAVMGENAQVAIAGPQALPNVTGPLLDDCGNLAGYSTADGVQSMSTSEAPAYLWKETLKRLLAEIQLLPRISDCRQQSEGTAEPAEETTEPEPEAATDAELEKPADEMVEDKPEDQPPPAQDEQSDAVEEQQDQEQPPAPDVLEELEILPPYEDDSMQADVVEIEESPPSDDTTVPTWIWLVAAVLLIGAGLVLHLIRSRTWNTTGDTDPPPEAQSTVPVDQESEPEYSTSGLTSSLDSRLVISGLLADGTAFEADCNVSRQAINLLIGRSHADLMIDSPAVSRHHASLNGTSESLTISDLASSNGTSINGVPCLEGETMFIKPGDIIVLGNVRFSYEILPDSKAGRQDRK
jgi:hypothetical protein